MYARGNCFLHFAFVIRFRSFLDLRFLTYCLYAGSVHEMCTRVSVFVYMYLHTYMFVHRSVGIFVLSEFTSIICSGLELSRSCLFQDCCVVLYHFVKYSIMPIIYLLCIQYYICIFFVFCICNIFCSVFALSSACLSFANHFFQHGSILFYCVVTGTNVL